MKLAISRWPCFHCYWDFTWFLFIGFYFEVKSSEVMAKDLVLTPGFPWIELLLHARHDLPVHRTRYIENQNSHWVLKNNRSPHCEVLGLAQERVRIKVSRFRELVICQVFLSNSLLLLESVVTMWWLYLLCGYVVNILNYIHRLYCIYSTNGSNTTTKEVSHVLFFREHMNWKESKLVMC